MGTPAQEIAALEANIAKLQADLDELQATGVKSFLDDLAASNLGSRDIPVRQTAELIRLWEYHKANGSLPAR